MTNDEKSFFYFTLHDFDKVGHISHLEFTNCAFNLLIKFDFFLEQKARWPRTFTLNESQFR